MANPFDLDAVSALERASGSLVTVVGAPRARIAALRQQAYDGSPVASQSPKSMQSTENTFETVEMMTENAAEELELGTAADVVDEIIRVGVVQGATDVHIEPYTDDVRIRYRIDGVLRTGRSYPGHLQTAIAARLKILSGLNIAESRLPQDGRFRRTAGGREIDLRISTFPAMHGEDIVLRLLDRSRVALSLSSLGMLPEDIKLFRRALQRTYGLIAVTGPTGSGKTTTLYSALTELNRGDRCILTLEDPIEYELDGVRQSQIDVRAGLTFASGLRSMLRHDPDVILVGEMRDEETVRIGLSAALTGHLVMSTLHTNSAAGAIPRMLDMGVEPFILASSLILVVAQRLVRVLCPQCREPADVSEKLRERFGLGDTVVYKPLGCKACRHTGYRGRIGIYELLPITEEIETATQERASAEQIQKLSPRPSLFQSGLTKVKDGTTSLDELMRAATS